MDDLSFEELEKLIKEKEKEKYQNTLNKKLLKLKQKEERRRKRQLNKILKYNDEFKKIEMGIDFFGKNNIHMIIGFLGEDKTPEERKRLTKLGKEFISMFKEEKKEVKEIDKTEENEVNNENIEEPKENLENNG